MRTIDDAAGFPSLMSLPKTTRAGTPYLVKPGASMIAKTMVDLTGAQYFLGGFDQKLGFGEYLDDSTPLSYVSRLVKFAGQLCYMSFGSKRTMNDEAAKYFANIKSSGHGSVLEHASFSFLFYGISRSITHELVRHRAGFAYSQVSQRYVSGKVLRFVERPEFQDGGELHVRFCERIDRASADYEEIAKNLIARQKAGAEIMSAEAHTDLRKKVQQAARAVLPNETEAPIVASANLRAWRHFMEMRANEHAETEIRALAIIVYELLMVVEPMLLSDYRIVTLKDGTRALETDYVKV